MAATGKTPILLYGSTTATNQPSAGNLTNSSDGCEIAINVADKNLFFKDATNTVNTVPIRQSSASSDGWLSSADWSTFNSKQPAGSYLTSVTVDAPLTGAGTSGSHLSIPAASGGTNGYLTSADWTTFNSKQPAGTYVTSVTGTAPVVSSGGTTPAISMAAATSSVNGYLTSTDWTTFNSKQTALVSGTNIKTVGGVTVLGSGDVSAPTFTGTTLVKSSEAYLGIQATNPSGTLWYLISGGGGNVTNGYLGLFNGTSGNLVWAIAPSTTQDFVTTTTGDLQVRTGNVVISTSGKGIDFSATPGTGTSELLADYEEGTWTVQFYDASSAGTASATTSTGYYTKVGRQVTCQFAVQNIDTTGMASGNNFYISLPFAAAATNGAGAGPISLEYFTYPAGRVQAVLAVSASASRAVIRTSASGTTGANVLVSGLSSGAADIEWASITYNA